MDTTIHNPPSTGLGSREAENIVYRELLNPHHEKTYPTGYWFVQLFFASLFVPVLGAGLIVAWTAIYELLPAAGSTLFPEWLRPIWGSVIRPVTIALLWVHIIVGFITVFSMYAVWMERKVSAHMQCRVGPMAVGFKNLLLNLDGRWWLGPIRWFSRLPLIRWILQTKGDLIRIPLLPIPKWASFHGFGQTLADGIKLMAKEDLIPRGADAWLFALAPVLAFTGVFISFAILPYHGVGGAGIPVDLNAAVFYFSAVTSIEAIGVVMAGWASNNKWALFGAMRAATQVVSYELPLGLVLLLVVLTAGSLNMGAIVADQSSDSYGLLAWYVFRNPFLTMGFLLYFIASLAETKRAPFDLPEAESELISGFHTEYSSMRFSIFFLAEYASMYVVAAFAAVMFLGGWLTGIPPLDIWVREVAASNNLPMRLAAAGLGTFVIVSKAMILVFFQMAARWTYPRIRLDQVMYLCLKVMLPFSMAIVLGGAVWELFLGGRAPFGLFALK